MIFKARIVTLMVRVTVIGYTILQTVVSLTCLDSLYTISGMHKPIAVSQTPKQTSLLRRSLFRLEFLAFMAWTIVIYLSKLMHVRNNIQL